MIDLHMFSLPNSITNFNNSHVLIPDKSLDYFELLWSYDLIFRIINTLMIPAIYFIDNIKMTSPSLIIQILILSCATTDIYAESSLPNLGDSSDAIISRQQEYKLGQMLLKVINSRSSTIQDPIVKDYLENFIYHLAENSELDDKRLNSVIIKDIQMNAFAAPGGVIGINTGLFFYARSEQEFASVLAHELAHLSQRHYARKLEAQQRQQLPTLLAILGGLILTATTGELGIIALSSTMAGVQDSQLRFSRHNEEEADRIGIKNLASAGYDPRAMPKLFERMNRHNSSDNQFEFLRTHPVTSKRVTDSMGRAEQYSKTHNPDHIDYHIMRTRISVITSDSLPNTTNKLEKKLQNLSLKSTKNMTYESTLTHEQEVQITRYGLALAYLYTGNPIKSEKVYRSLIKTDVNNIYYQLLYTYIMFETGNNKKAIASIENLLSYNPGSYPLSMAYAQLLFSDKQYKKASMQLKHMSQKRPDDFSVWYQLADAAGKAGDLITYRTARSEFFFLIGNFDEATKEIQRAIRLTKNNFQKRSAFKEKLKLINDYQASFNL